MKKPDLHLHVIPIQLVERYLAERKIDAVLTILGPGEAETDAAFFKRPRINVPNTIVAASDIHCGAIWTPQDVEDAKTEGLIEVDAGHVKEIMDFASQVIELSRMKRTEIIVHCHMGYSRSPAAAAIILAILKGPGKEAATARRLFEIAPITHPNPMFLKIADELLGRGGALVSAFAAEQSKQDRTQRKKAQQGYL